MTKQEFIELARNQIIYLDGATGSNLMKAGMPSGVCPEAWILEHKDIFVGLQRKYVEAGTNILYAPTFTANRIKLSEYGLQDQLISMNQKLVSYSKEAANGQAYVAGNLTMTGEQLAPMGKLQFEELVEVYKEQIKALEVAGVDLLVVETMMSLQETRAALLAAKEVSDLPVIVTMTFESDFRTLYGTDPLTAAVVLTSLGAVAIGTNCSTGPDQMKEVIREMAKGTTLPIIAKPNAGLPYLDEDGMTQYNLGPEEFGVQMVELYKSGATVLGGCCGTTPEHIYHLVKQTKSLSASEILEIRSKELTTKRFLASERQTFDFTLDSGFFVIGERINPTGKKKFQEAIRAKDYDIIAEFATQQEEAGASVLDVNMGMSGVDEKATMLRALEEVSNVTSLPICIDSSYIEVMEVALRAYPGKALINSISLEESKCEPLLKLASHYGAMFVLLPLSDEGLPKSLEEKIEIIDKVVTKALSYGIKREDIMVDGLVTTVGANKTAALETLETIRYCKENQLATVCGLSNISFGLPERGYVNTTFLTLAIGAGLTCAIANPSQDLLMNCAFASDLLLNKESADLRYIERMNAAKEKADPIVVSQTKVELDPKEKLREAVLKGQQTVIVALTKEVISLGLEAKQVLDQILLPAINKVGDLFDKGTYFLPQLIKSAEAMKLSIEYLEPMLMQNHADQEQETIVIATVKGDIHDIGKNLVALMLKNHGFRVIDLGKDVEREAIIEAAIKENAKIIALSALMTTTMQEMRQVIVAAKEKSLDCKIIIGGAVITQEYADEIGADGYSKDAADAVKLAKKLLKSE